MIFKKHDNIYDYIHKLEKDTSLMIFVEIFDKLELQFESCEKGLLPLIRLFINNKKLLIGNYIVDKVIGKASASILIESNISFCYADTISYDAISLFESSKKIKFEFAKKVPKILKKDMSSICPMEVMLSDCNNSKDCCKILTNFFENKI